MAIPKSFPHAEAEARWYAAWEAAGCFHSEPDDREPYTIVMPPPNVTGVLHMGHALNNSIQDVLIRRARSQGYNTCWVPGTDHASIATEAKVVEGLKSRGIDKAGLSRHEFLAHAWEWKEKYGGIILQQLRKLGCALDWDRTHFTMDEAYYRAVIRVFVELYNKGLIYRGVKMINWDPQAQTALSDEEVQHRAATGALYYVAYPVVDADGNPVPGTGDGIVIATVRPETIPGDTAVCVHPEDPRYAAYQGLYCLVPVVNRRVPIIFDEYIDREFGTGALKVTPAHDINDYNLGLKHGLPVVDTIAADGRMTAEAGPYEGLDRFEARKKIVEDLRASGQLIKEEPYANQVGHSERTGAVIEPRLSMQWWCKMGELAGPALDAVINDDVQFLPPKYKNLYRHWMENIHDWCISRQLWWGQRIPAWYDEAGAVYVGESLTDVEARNPSVRIVRQDEDVLDTWFSSWLWPMQVFGWNDAPENKELAYYYPTSTLVTAPEIIFFWVARMIMAGEHFLGKKPFERVYFTGIVRDKKGRKMSKSLGNSPDLLQLIDDFGADAVRFSVLISSPAGNDLLYDEGALDQGRAFNNKLWNALKLVKSWEDRVNDARADEPVPFALRWMDARIAEASEEIARLMDDFRISEALKTVYSLIWDDFCSWYLEWVKPPYEGTIAPLVWAGTVRCFERLLGLLHPFMPFVTEEIYQQLHPRAEDDFLMNRRAEKVDKPSEALLGAGSRLQATITALRDARAKAGLKNKDAIRIGYSSADPDFYILTADLLSRQAGLESLASADAPTPGAVSMVVGADRLYLSLPEGTVDAGAQREGLQKDLEYTRGFLASVEKKLSNERFVQNAKPDVVAAEQKKRQDALEKIAALEQSLSGA